MIPGQRLITYNMIHEKLINFVVDSEFWENMTIISGIQIWQYK